MIRLSVPARQALARLTLPVLFVISFGVILLGKVDTVVVERARMSLGDALAPIYAALALPVRESRSALNDVVSFWALHEENATVRAENQRLRRWQNVALALAAENAELKRQLHWIPHPGASFVTARVVADDGGVYVKAVLLSVGPHHLIHKGEIVLDAHGLVGRVIDVGARSARVLLITDLNSRIPVMLQDTRERAILSGTNGPCPRLLYWTDTAPREGEHVVTSGEANVLPPGLPVGIVHYTPDHVAVVVPDAALDRLDIVRVFDYPTTGSAVLASPLPPQLARVD